MPATPEKALERARAHVTRYHPGKRVVRLLEDPSDYLVELQKDPDVQLNGTAIFIDKETGAVREVVAITQMDRIVRMQPVAP